MGKLRFREINYLKLTQQIISADLRLQLCALATTPGSAGGELLSRSRPLRQEDMVEKLGAKACEFPVYPALL